METVHTHVMKSKIPPQMAVSETTFKLKMIVLFALSSSSTALLLATIKYKNIKIQEKM